MIMKKFPEEMTKKELKEFCENLKRRSRGSKCISLDEFLKKQEKKRKRLKKSTKK